LRIASALVLAPPALAAAWFGGWAFTALVLLAAGLMGWEWARLTGCGDRALPALVTIAALLPTCAIALGDARLAIVLLLGGMALVWLAATRAGAPAAPWTALGLGWVALPCVACLWLGRVAGQGAVLWLFATVWATDTGAYAAGRFFGGPRLAPAVSPNKTWSGSVGGLAAAAIVGWATARLGGGAAAALVAASVGLGIAAQVGDLAESLAKRRFGAKDSGHLIPGHGGLLDRLDGMLTAIVFAAVLTLATGASPLAWEG
jgi:phosphatidate cytidylyltransferase